MLHGLNLKSLSRPIFPSHLHFLIQLRKLTHSVQFSRSIVSVSATPWTAACQPSLSITNSRNLIKLMSTELVMSSNHLILCRPLLLPLIFPSTRVFSAALWSLQNPQLPKPSRFWRRRHPTPAQALESKASLKTKGISSLHLVSGKKKSHSFTKNEKASPTLPFLSLQ